MKTEVEKVDYLWKGGWIENNGGWWHPPSCTASWPLNEAFEMAKRDEERGLRMSVEQCRDYHRSLGVDENVSRGLLGIGKAVE